MIWFGFRCLMDNWSQYGKSVSCITILFLNLPITRSDIRPHIKWAVRLVIAYALWPYQSSYKFININKLQLYPQSNPCSSLKWPYAITRLTIHFLCGLTSDLVIFKVRKGIVMHDTECPYWYQVSLNNKKTTQSPQPFNASIGSSSLVQFLLFNDTWSQ